MRLVTYLKCTIYTLANAPGLNMFDKELKEIEGGTWGGCKNKHWCYMSGGANKLMKPVTYLKYTFHTLAKAPSLDVFGPELMEIQGRDMGGLQK
jgi:hypothetical protein